MTTFGSKALHLDTFPAKIPYWGSFAPTSRQAAQIDPQNAETDQTGGKCDPFGRKGNERALNGHLSDVRRQMGGAKRNGPFRALSAALTAKWVELPPSLVVSILGVNLRRLP